MKNKYLEIYELNSVIDLGIKVTNDRYSIIKDPEDNSYIMYDNDFGGGYNTYFSNDDKFKAIEKFLNESGVEKLEPFMLQLKKSFKTPIVTFNAGYSCLSHIWAQYLGTSHINFIRLYNERKFDEWFELKI